jgi:RES domain-containing protein
MLVFRITIAKWAGKLTGSGYPARWNSRGRYVIYSASTRALACLENLVHRSGEGRSVHFMLTEISIPDDCSMEKVHPAGLPDNWFKSDNYSPCREVGDRWVDAGKSLLLRVPSAIIRDEHNILINPNHPEFSGVSVNQIVPFDFDKRI